MSGIVGVYSLDNKGRSDIVNKVHEAMCFNQHRGEEGASIATARNSRDSCFAVENGKGFVNDAIGKRLENLRTQEPVTSIGYNVYEKNVGEKPAVVDGKRYKIAFVMDGHILGLGPEDKSMELAKFYSKHLESTNDFYEAGKRFMDEYFGGGSYSISMLINDGNETKQVVMRDPFGIKPLCIGIVDGMVIVSSETIGLQGAKAKFRRYIEPGELLVLSKGMTGSDLDKSEILKKYLHAHCGFEFLYYANKISVLEGVYCGAFRRKMGELIAEKYPKIFEKLDLPVCSPDSGRGILSGSPKRPEEVIMKLAGVRRIFQIDDPNLRARLAGLKWAYDEELIKEYVKELGRDIIAFIYEDSIVRNTNCRVMVQNMKNIDGVKEVYIIPSSPALCFPRIRDFENLEREKLAAESMYDLPVEEIGRRVAEDNGANGVLYPTIELMGKALGTNDFCKGCFNGQYPVSMEWLNKYSSNLPTGYSSLID